MAGITQVCNDTSEKIELFPPQGLYLKPLAKINVCVQLPQLKQPGKSISNWEVMERVKHMARPHSFLTLKIIKSTLEFIRLEGETETKALIKTLIQRLDAKTIKLSGFPDILKVKAAEAKVSFPLRHDWDSYFRDAKNMNEMKSGERPDTIHFRDLPTRWFASARSRESDKPNEQYLKRTWEGYGEVRCVDIPMLDPYRKEMTTSTKSGAIQTFTYGQDLTFEAFVQFKEYIGFVKAMDSLRGMKLLYIGEDEKAYTANIKVDFDKTKHLSDKSIKKRRIERWKLEQLEKEREDKVRNEREEEERKQEEERRKKREEEEDKERKRIEKVQKKEDRRKSREEKRKHKALQKRKKEEEKKLQQKIALEERKFLIAQRKLESIRLMSELFNAVKKIKVKEDLEKHEREAEEMRKKELEMEQIQKEQDLKRKLEARKRKKDRLERQEHELRSKILKNWKVKEEREEEIQRESLRKKIAGQGKMKSAVVVKK
ncbi:A-kinase anchor protein 17A-like [Mizuhopecten yessoensis]|uniref:A-kinase anchor protein 17A n=1 Tax=Mizuhopecten yessoensis TaxID=6573 RepID=A0A210QAP1_MIZYE|nr:A-kinase anchor protein 17A-like [Mizuhopecten yessoensis]OWF45803.1 A-kinase anchor protein 17A [Mizuhopecten yessoensis]